MRPDHLVLALLWSAYCAVHSALISTTAANSFKRVLGNHYSFYRLIFNAFSLVTLVPLVMYSRSLYRRDPLLFGWSGNWRAMNGIRTAFYLVHSMGAAQGFEETDRQAAMCFGDAARAQGVQRIICLGGLGEGSGRLSPHLRSRQEVGEILRNSGVRVIEYRASNYTQRHK